MPLFALLAAALLAAAGHTLLQPYRAAGVSSSVEAERRGKRGASDERIRANRLWRACHGIWGAVRWAGAEA